MRNHSKRTEQWCMTGPFMARRFYIWP